MKDIWRGHVLRLFDRGYGFIELYADEAGKEAVDPKNAGVYFNAASLTNHEFDLLKTGARVELEIASDPRGPRAVRVTVVENGQGDGIRPRGRVRRQRKAGRTA